MDLLCHYTWPGNIRELENLIRRLLVTRHNGQVEETHLDDLKTSATIEKKTILNYQTQTYRDALTAVTAEFEIDYLAFHLNQNNFNISKTAEIIGLSRVALHKKIKDYNIENPATK